MDEEKEKSIPWYEKEILVKQGMLYEALNYYLDNTDDDWDYYDIAGDVLQKIERDKKREQALDNLSAKFRL